MALLLQNMDTFVGVVTHSDISSYALGVIFSHQGVVDFLLQNMDTFVEAAANRGANPYLWIKLIEINQGVVDFLLQNPDVFIRVVTRPYIPADALDAIFGHPGAVDHLLQNMEALIEAAANRGVNPHLWIKLIETNPDAVEFLLRDADVDVFARVVTNPHISAGALDTIFSYQDAVGLLLQNPGTFARVATHQNISTNALDTIFGYQGVVWLFDENPKAFVEVTANQRSASAIMRNPTLVQILGGYPRLRGRINELARAKTRSWGCSCNVM